jgi:hypothetical protein
MPIRRAPTLGFYVALVPPAVLAIDMVYENTILSWERGPQMIGFTLFHTVGIVLLPAALASAIWCAWAILTPIFTKRWNLGNIGGVVAIIFLLGIASLSYGFWVGAFAKRIASGPYAVEFLVYMAGLGEQSAVGSLLDAGVPINESNKQGYRAVDSAINANRPAVRSYLESRGGTDKRF